MKPGEPYRQACNRQACIRRDSCTKDKDRLRNDRPGRAAAFPVGRAFPEVEPTASRQIGRHAWR
eukprot:scaffold167631_cov42-Prasinocladus_malaysianus.AAC.1